MKYWKKYTKEEQNKRIDDALSKNVNFLTDVSLGYPASKLDETVFSSNAPFLKDSPLLRSFVANPNHIGCHTTGISETAFSGTHEIEREVLQVLAVDIFKCKDGNFDGYIATGGTEANIQAMWIYRNLYKREFNAKQEEIVIICSEDSHYSMPKGANILNLDIVFVPVEFYTREIEEAQLNQVVNEQKEKGKKYFIVVSNMATTMFGSVDSPELYAKVLLAQKVDFKIHIDGAFGGFIYPFHKEKTAVNFTNEHINSITIDAHKMLQAPYGTGIFLCKKGLMKNTLTKEAQYVNGMDLTFVGSRGGANAIAIWMILFSYGFYGWFEKISILLMRTKWFCEQLDALNIKYYRHKRMNIVTIHAAYIPDEIALKYDLVPDTHDGNHKWLKVVIMNHVELDDLMALIDEIKISISNSHS
ncbi:MAG: pyridoxal-dependent decarboxylase [Flavobacteriaceae bacterium]|nr:pyridoxal-dependent decarboxylase [Flavobacteriaceae bacterium]